MLPATTEAPSTHPQSPLGSPRAATTHYPKLESGLRRALAALLMAGTIVTLEQRGLGQADASQPSDALKGLSLQELMDLEVTTVSRQREPYRNAAAAIQVITQEDIRRSGATSIAEALRLAGNLAVAQKNSRQWAITARGFNTDLANKLLVLIDGRTVYTPLFSGVFWDRQDYLLEDIDRIEVISGPGGTLWGANAVNGVINVITKTAGATQGAYVETGGGSRFRDFAAARYGATLAPNVFFRIYGKYFDRNSEAFPDGSSASDAWRSGQTGFRLDGARIRDAFTLQGDFYKTREDIPTGRQSNVSGGNILARWSRSFSDESDLKLQLYYDRTHFADPIPKQLLNGILGAPAGTLKDDLHTYDADFQHRFAWGGRNHVVWGLGYRLTHDAVAAAPSLAFVPPVRERNLFSAFAQDELTITSKLALTYGTKVEHNDYTGFELEPNVRLQWQAATNQLLWTAVSRAVRMPSRVDRDERLATPALAPFLTNILIGGPNFDSESVVAYEAGYRTQFGQSASVSISTFFNDYDKLRSTSMSPPRPLPFPLFFENNLEGNTYGVEFAGTYQVRPWWRFSASYNFLNENIRVEPGQRDFNNALNETADPEHRSAVRSTLNLPWRLELTSGLRWIDSFRFNTGGAPSTVPGYAEVDGRLAWQPSDSIELSIAGQNLLHDHHLEYVISGSNPREEIRRSVYGKLAFRW